MVELRGTARDNESSFVRRVLSALRRVPPGRVVTYGDLAELAGRPGAARAVGNIMRRAGVPGLPYHRVIAAGGRLGGYGGNEGMKAGLLRQEGLVVIGRRVRDFEKVRWPGSATAPPRDVRSAAASGRRSAASTRSNLRRRRT